MAKYIMEDENLCSVCNTIQEYVVTSIPDDPETGITLNHKRRRICAGCFADELTTRDDGIVSPDLLAYYRSHDTRNKK